LDRVGQAALVRRTHTGQAARHDLARLSHELPKQADILIVHAVDLLDAELANLLAAEELASAFARSARTSTGTTAGTRATRAAIPTVGTRCRSGAPSFGRSHRGRCIRRFVCHVSPSGQRP